MIIPMPLALPDSNYMYVCVYLYTWAKNVCIYIYTFYFLLEYKYDTMILKP